MVDQRTMHRSAAIGTAVCGAAFLVFVAVQPNRNPFPRAAWDQLANSTVSERVVWTVLVAISLAALVVKRRSDRAKNVLTVILLAVAVGSVVGHIALLALSQETPEYWIYLTDFGVFRWLLAPWYAGYSITLMIGCIGVWIALADQSDTHPTRRAR